MIELLEQALFTAWLKTKEPSSAVGIASMSDVCPIAEYLHSCGLKDVSAWPDHIYIDKEEVLTPNWATRFIIQVDSNFSEDVTAQEALQIMHEIEIASFDDAR